MNILVIIPKVVQGFIDKFPEVRNNAYKYFNYDRRVYEESAPRGDIRSNYKGPDDLTDADYDSLVQYAKTIVDPRLVKYSTRVACEDALHMAIRSFNNGMFDGKISSNRYNVLLDNMLGVRIAKKKKEGEPKEISKYVLKKLELKPGEVPIRQRIRQRKGPALYREKGKVKIVKEAAVEINDYLSKFMELVSQLPTKDMDLVRQLVGRWSQTKQLVKNVLQDAAKEDPEYVKNVAEDFRKGSALLDKLQSIYEADKKFDMESIKTYLEPLQDLISKGSEESAPLEAEPAPESIPEEEPEPIQK